MFQIFLRASSSFREKFIPTIPRGVDGEHYKRPTEKGLNEFRNENCPSVEWHRPSGRADEQVRSGQFLVLDGECTISFLMT